MLATTRRSANAAKFAKPKKKKLIGASEQFLNVSIGETIDLWIGSMLLCCFYLFFFLKKIELIVMAIFPAVDVDLITAVVLQK